VKGADQCGQFVLCDVLQLVEKQDHRRAALPRRGPHGDDQRAEVGFEIAAVGQAWLRPDVEPQFQIAVLDLERLGEAGECAKRSADAGAHPLGRIEFE